MLQIVSMLPLTEKVFLVSGLDPKSDLNQLKIRLEPIGDRETRERVEVARSGTKMQFSSDDHRLSILPLSTLCMSSKYEPSTKLLSFKRQMYSSPFHVGNFFF